MTKLQLARRIARQHRISQARAEVLVDEVLAAMKIALRTGQRVTIRSLGSFEVRSYAAYVARNPKSGAKVPVRARRLPFFIAGKHITDRLNPAPAAEPSVPVAGQATWANRTALHVPRAQGATGESPHATAPARASS